MHLDDRVGGDDTVGMKGVTRSGLILGVITAVVAVTVEITERSASSLFLGESYTFQETLVVERLGDAWLIAEAPWPIYCWEV